MNEPYEQEIDLKWLLYRMLRAWKSIVLTALFAAILVGGVKFALNYSVFSSESYRLQQEAAYAEAYSAWEETNQQIILEINALQLNKSEQISYNENSILMQINPFHEHQATFDLYVECNDLALTNPSYSSFALSGRLLQIYQSFLIGGELLQYIQDNLGDDTELRYLQELIVIKPNYNTNTLTCTIRHIDAEPCQELTLLVLEGLQLKKEKLLSSVGMHNLIVTTPAFVEQVNPDLEKKQKSNLQILATLDTKLKELQSSLESNAAPSAANQQSAFIQAARSAVKYLLISGVAVAFVMAILIAGACIVSGKLLNPNDMKSRFGLHIIAQLPQSRKKRPFAFVSRWIAKLFGITTRPEDYDKLAKTCSFSIKSLLASKADEEEHITIAFTGILDAEHLQSILCTDDFDSNYTLLFAPDLLSDAASIEKINTADYVVFVVEQEHSSLSDIEKQLAALKAWDKTVLGTIVLNTDAIM